MSYFKLLALVSWQTAQSATTVRPYKFGFTIEEQQHRQEQRGELAGGGEGISEKRGNYAANWHCWLID